VTAFIRMLEVTNTSREEDLGVDFADLYEESALARYYSIL
jgi:hypothetical protein